MAHRNRGPVVMFVAGSAISAVSVAVLELGHLRTYAILAGVLVTVAGCLLGLRTRHAEEERHDEEVAVLRNNLHVAGLDVKDARVRIAELERELSLHSQALARLLDH